MVGPASPGYKLTSRPRPMMCGCGWHGNDQELMQRTVYKAPEYKNPITDTCCPKCGNAWTLRYLDRTEYDPAELFQTPAERAEPKPEGWGQW